MSGPRPRWDESPMVDTAPVVPFVLPAPWGTHDGRVPPCRAAARPLATRLRTACKNTSEAHSSVTSVPCASARRVNCSVHTLASRPDPPGAPQPLLLQKRAKGVPRDR